MLICFERHQKIIVVLRALLRFIVCSVFRNFIEAVVIIIDSREIQHLGRDGPPLPADLVAF